MKIIKILGLGLAALLALQACDDDEDVPSQTATISGLTCSNAVFSSAATSGTAYTGTFTIPYTGGNGIAYTAGTGIASTGVTGLSATLNADTLSSGSGNLTYAVTGTPATSGNAAFVVNFGGQNCTVTMPVDSSTTSPPAGQ